MIAPFSKFYGEIWFGYCLNTGIRFFWRFHFKAIGKSIGSSKIGTRDFQNSPSFARLSCFCMTVSGNFERFQYFNFELDFLENEKLFQKTRVRFFN